MGKPATCDLASWTFIRPANGESRDLVHFMLDSVVCCSSSVDMAPSAVDRGHTQLPGKQLDAGDGLVIHPFCV